MSFSSAGRPLGEINTTPLIDVMLVLLIMLILTIPISLNSLDFDLPRPGIDAPEPDAMKNSLVLTANDRLLWNGSSVSHAELAGALARVRNMRPEPAVLFEPEAQASYQASAFTLRIVKASKVTHFGFVGNDKYRSY